MYDEVAVVSRCAIAAVVSRGAILPVGPGVPAGGSVVDAGGLRRGANPRECAPITRRSGARRPRPPARGAHHPEGRFGDAEVFCARRHIFVTEAGEEVPFIIVGLNVLSYERNFPGDLASLRAFSGK